MTNSPPSVSVIMPAYNSEKYIERAIDSILDQTHQDLELVIGDDCSVDSTWDIINEYAARDRRVKVFRNEQNAGPAATFRRGVEISTGPVIAAMDSDDISVPRRLERQLQALREHPDASVIGSYASHINESDVILSLSKTGPPTIEEFHARRNRGEATMVFGGTAMFKRVDYESVGGFDASLRAAADIEFCDRMSELGPVLAVPEPLLLYRIYSKSNVMMRFREGRRTHRYLDERHAARRAETPLPTREEYAARERDLPLWKRIDIWRDDFAQFYYRKAGLAFAEGRKPYTAIYLLLAGLARPIWVIARLWEQRLSPEARRVHGGGA